VSVNLLLAHQYSGRSVAVLMGSLAKDPTKLIDSDHLKTLQFLLLLIERENDDDGDKSIDYRLK
jgi:hypothetical protein